MKPLEVTFWVLFCVGIGVVVWLVVGNTPSMEQSVAIITLSLVIKNGIDIKGVKKDISYLRRDFRSHKHN